MEYVFGKNGGMEYVRVSGGSMSPGTHEVSMEYPDMVVTHKCIVDGIIKEDGADKWYAIHEHFKTVDKTRGFNAAVEAVGSKTEQSQAIIDYNMMMGKLDDPEQEVNGDE